MNSAHILFSCLVYICALSTLANSLALVRERRGIMEEAEEIIKQYKDNVDMNNAGQLAELVAKHKVDKCLARVICELSNNPKSHGEIGQKFAQALLKFRQSKHELVRQYLEAMTLGTKSKDIQVCKSAFACAHSTEEAIQVGAKVFRIA